MAAINDATLTNSSNSLQFLFRAVAPFRNRKSQPAQAVPLVDATAANNLLFRFVGQTEEVTFTFVLSIE